MGYKPTKHRNALLKIVKEKEMILLIDAVKRMNVSSSSILKRTCTELENEGKIKMEKIKVRYGNGNLNDCWLLYLPNIDYNQVLEYEKELVNRPFVSPLKDHHCYKTNNNNVIDLKQHVNENEHEMEIRKYNDEIVLTSNDISKLHNKEIREIHYILERNINRFTKNVHYYEIDRKEAKSISNAFGKLFTSNNQKKAYLFTERGYLLLVKPFEDEQSWNVQDMLINNYFKFKSVSTNNTSAEVEVRNEGLDVLNIMEIMITEMKKEKSRVDKLESKINSIVTILSQ